MRRAGILALMVGVFLMAVPQRASADWWEWLEEYSGIGPAEDYWPSMSGRFACWGPLGSTDPVGIAVPNSAAFRLAPSDSKRCLYFDHHYFEASPDEVQGYPDVRVRMLEFGLSMDLDDAQAVELGAGIGAVQFTAKENSFGGITRPEKTTWKKLITLARVTVRPGRLIAGTAGDRDSGRLAGLKDIFTLYYKLTLQGGMSGDDWNQIPRGGAGLFSSEAEVISAGGLMLDVRELVRAISGR